mmetsp:Transcript_29244/g.64908  ORF Transcript_29244/g.64908 Transcript_29244/m.64908 type:complete len:166 (-) Transcript_29244:74-571(-)|eukprot:CAMPEP_0173193658 /NCGR_PEP_ID=MMETSP1141-20130122/14072_1 /TAXON_ID=483371 /ORGANISM="non described non described, Strain CCMP2298" /LENGTH=165 /DNA_ID=CAMNT_0014118001 /DNA_START=114 /DNA_END=611 /DNA_ORIENTATION=-
MARAYAWAVLCCMMCALVVQGWTGNMGLGSAMRKARRIAAVAVVSSALSPLSPMSMYTPPAFADTVAVDASVEQQVRAQRRDSEVRERERSEIQERSDISLNVPSRPTVIALDEDEWKVKADDDAVTTVLKLIPSYKYFKIIAKEYSSRSSNYVEGQDSMLSPIF